MRDFWKQFAMNLLIRALSSLSIYAVSTGLISSLQAQLVTVVVATFIFNAIYGLINRALAKWHFDLARLIPNAVTVEKIQAISAGVSGITKVKESLRGELPFASDSDIHYTED